MEREIKFRAYWTFDKSMHYDDVSKLISINDDGSINNSCGTGTTHVMQYTGLKDKKGKEIYEGDIVNVTACHSDYKNRHFLIVFDTGAFQLLVDGNDELPPVAFISYAVQYNKRHKPLKSCNDVTQFIEVIGNIYEHSYLLQDEK